MEGLFYRGPDGKEVLVRAVEGLAGKGALIVRVHGHLSDQDTRELEESLAKRLGRRVMVLDSRFGEIYRLEE